MLSVRAPGKRGSLVRVFLLAFVLFAYFMPRWADWNIDSRLDLVHAIVDGHTFRIDTYHWNTWDKAVFAHHFYSDKAPGTAFLGAIVYAGFIGARQTPGLGGAVRQVERSGAWNDAISLGRSATQYSPGPKGSRLGGCQRAGGGNVQYIPWGNRLYPPFREWALSKYVVTIGVDALLSALFVTFFFWFLGFFTTRRVYRWLLTILYAAGTVALPYSTVFYSHQLVAGFLFTAFALLFLRYRGHVGKWSAPAAGFLLGFSVLTEYTVALVVVAVALYALFALRRSPGMLLASAAAGAVPLALLLFYNYACFGNPIDTGYSHDFCWSAAQAAGFAGFTTPQSGPLFDLTFGSFRGLFYMSPFLLAAVPGAWIMARRGYRIEAVLCLAIAITFIVTISAYWGWNGGKVDGPRYLVPVVPFLAFPVIFIFDASRRFPAIWIITAPLAIISLVVTWAGFLGGELFPISWLRTPLFDYSLPELKANHIAPNAGFFLGLQGWQSLVPLVVLLSLIALSGNVLRSRKRHSAPAPVQVPT
ncbi:MAG: hypothetical protein NVSMB52_00660 [Chloroflexota bacterium]